MYIYIYIYIKFVLCLAFFLRDSNNTSCEGCMYFVLFQISCGRVHHLFSTMHNDLALDYDVTQHSTFCEILCLITYYVSPINLKIKYKCSALSEWQSHIWENYDVTRCTDILQNRICVTVHYVFDHLCFRPLNLEIKYKCSLQSTFQNADGVVGDYL